MIAPSAILAKYFQDQSVFTDPAYGFNWPVFISNMPDDKTLSSDVAAVYDTAPLKDGRIMNGGENIFHHGIQIAMRSSEYLAGYNKAQAVLTLLESTINQEVTVDGTTYILWNVSNTSGVVWAGVEAVAKRRNLFTINILLTVKES